MSRRNTTGSRGGGGDGYQVGYGKPPKHSQFRPGQSGNPAGRRKGVRNLKTDVMDMLATPVKVKEGGRTRTRSTQKAVLILREKVFKDNTRALDRFLELAMRFNDDAAEVGQAQPLPADDQAILAAYVAECVPTGTSPVTADEDANPASKPGARSNKKAPR
jgi:Family of unknown function (DUF5681)